VLFTGCAEPPDSFPGGSCVLPQKFCAGPIALSDTARTVGLNLPVVAGRMEGNPMTTKLTIREHLIQQLRLMPVGEPTTMPDNIADEIGVTRRAVEHVLGALDSEGVIVWHRKTRGGIRRPWYTITCVTDLAEEVAR